MLAARLHLCPKTVRNHVSSIFNKLHVVDRPQTIVRAREADLALDRRNQASSPPSGFATGGRG